MVIGAYMLPAVMCMAYVPALTTVS